MSSPSLSKLATAAIAVLGAAALMIPAAAFAAPPSPAGSAAPVGPAALTAPAAPQARQGAARTVALPRGARRAALPAGERYVCPAPADAGQMECLSIVRGEPSDVGPVPAASAANGFYGPSELRSAYKVAAAAAHNGHGATIAIVDAFSDPRAAADLATYRSRFGLPACTVARGCLRIVNEFGDAGHLPAANWDWAGEESVDLDMVSAICPNCRILLVEARNAQIADLGIAENTAVAMGARYVSNSWAGQEFTSLAVFDPDFNHPGVVLDFASGDTGFGAAYPTDLQYVTAIGGTSLRHAAGQRGWSESVWGSRAFAAQGTGSGCSSLQAKPSWQRADVRAPDGCMNRTENDVAAVSDPATGVNIYDTYHSPNWPRGWNEFGGTSVATPIITAIYALAGNPAPRSYPGEYPYLNPGHLFPVTSGVNGTCEPYRRYLCHGVPGYNGPTGLGTPDGTAAFTAGRNRLVTVVDPGTADGTADAGWSLRISGLDTSAGSALHWTAAGLPAGTAIRGIAHTTDALIAGTLPAAGGSFRVTVTARDGTAAGSTHFTVVAVRSLAGAALRSGPLVLSSHNLCADGGTGAAGQPVLIRHCDQMPGQAWSYRADGGPDASGSLIAAGRCLALRAGSGVLAGCDGSAGERWRYLGLGRLQNLATGQCLAAPHLSSGAQVGTVRCNFSGGRRFQAWRIPAGPIVSGARSLCLDNPAGSQALDVQAQVTTCDGATGQQWSLSSTGTIRSNSGYCLDGSGSTVQNTGQVPDGTPVVLNICVGGADAQEVWLPTPAGELINAWSGLCLADYRSHGSGTNLVVEDCYGSAGEIWGLG